MGAVQDDSSDTCLIESFQIAWPFDRGPGCKSRLHIHDCSF
jgi:hypothetical protein